MSISTLSIPHQIDALPVVALNNGTAVQSSALAKVVGLKSYTAITMLGNNPALSTGETHTLSGVCESSQPIAESSPPPIVLDPSGYTIGCPSGYVPTQLPSP
jgi:hypothetical protein